jgi:hypothetical protein
VIYRAYMLAAVVWAAICLYAGLLDASGWGPWVIALGPLAVPKLLKLAAGFIFFGTRYRPGA